MPSGWGHPLAHVLGLPCLGSILDCHYWDFYIYLWERDTIRSSNRHIWGCPTEISLSVAQGDAVAFSSLLAWRLLLLKWKSAKPPSHSQWEHNVMSFLKLEQLKYSLRGSSKGLIRFGAHFYAISKKNLLLDSIHFVIACNVVVFCVVNSFFLSFFLYIFHVFWCFLRFYNVIKWMYVALSAFENSIKRFKYI